MKSRILLMLLVVSMVSCQQILGQSSSKLAFIIELSTTGATTPLKQFHKTQNPQDEPKYLDSLTGLGQRQQFLVGSELKRRYYEEQNFLNYSFDISQLWIQSTFDSKSVLSAQAQMLGMYPSETSVNQLNEWQQQNAIPPLYKDAQSYWEPYFQQWQQELGSNALYNNFNTFPINMYGHEDDLLLRMTTENCEKFQEDFQKYSDILANYIQPYKQDFFPRLAQLFDYNTVLLPQALEMCSYLLWADLHNVQLELNYTNEDLTQCSQLEAQLEKYFCYVNSELDGLATAEFFNYLEENLKSIDNSNHYLTTKFYQRVLKAKYELKEGPYDQPNYHLLVTEPINFKMILDQLISDSSKSNFNDLAVLPSSLLIIEVRLNNDGNYYVRASYNDQEVALGDCEQDCKLDSFLDWLENNTGYSNEEVEAKCQN